MATQTFDILESMHTNYISRIFIHIHFVDVDVIIELQDETYSVLERNGSFNVTVVKQGNPGHNITVSIVTVDNTTNGKSMTESLIYK